MIRKYLLSRGFALPEADWYKQVDLYKRWYQGNVRGFHDYWVFNGVNRKTVRRMSLGMAKTVCEDHASLLLNERVSITADGFDELPALLEDMRFRELGNRLVELSFALGTGAMVEYLGADERPRLDYIPADMIYPIEWDGPSVTACAFASRKVLGEELGYYVQIHTHGKNGTYRIENVYLTKTGAEVPPPDGVQPFVETGSPLPLYQLFSPACVNNVDLNSPMGISVYGNAIDQLKACDLLYDSYVNEYNLGRKRLMVPMSMATIQAQADGLLQPRFDPNDSVFYVYQQGDDEKQTLSEVGGSLRASEHELGLQRMLDALSKKCGLGAGRYRFDQAGANKTATEVISQQSDLYQTMRRNEKPLERAIRGMVRALAFLLGKNPELTVNVNFDDSIIEDEKATIERNLLLVNSGLKSKVAAIMAIEKVDEAEARKRLAEIAQENATALPGEGE